MRGKGEGGREKKKEEGKRGKQGDQKTVLFEAITTTTALLLSILPFVACPLSALLIHGEAQMSVRDEGRRMAAMLLGLMKAGNDGSSGSFLSFERSRELRGFFLIEDGSGERS